MQHFRPAHRDAELGAVGADARVALFKFQIHAVGGGKLE